MQKLWGDVQHSKDLEEYKWSELLRGSEIEVGREHRDRFLGGAGKDRGGEEGGGAGKGRAEDVDPAGAPEVVGVP